MHDTDGWLPPLRAGRQPAGRALLSWLDDPRAPRLCRVSGASGTGKTHLVTWLATVGTSPGAPATRRPAAVLSAAGLSLDSAVWLLALRLGVVARTPAELLDELRLDDRPQLLLLWDLNLAAEPVRIATELLGPLLALPNVRAVLEAAVGTPESDALRAVAAPAVLDLDEPQWTDLTRFARWYRRLAPDSPFPADAVHPNLRLAQLAARVPAGTDPSAGVAATWWSALPEDLRPAVQALAAAERSLTSQEWALLSDPDAVRRTGELLPPDSPAGDTWRLPTGPLRDAVGATGPDRAWVLASLAAALPRGFDGTADLTGVDQDLLGLLLHHAVRAGQARPLLDDPVFLAYAAPRAVTAAFAAVPDARWTACWQAAGPALIDEPDAGARAAVLRAQLLGRDEAAAEVLTTVGAPGWQADWAYRQPADAPRLATAALGQGPYTGWLLTADTEGSVRLLDLASGRPADQLWPPVPKQPRSLACLPDGTVAALDSWGALQVLAGTGLPDLGGRELSALSALPAIGDPAGVVHWLAGGSEPLHEGPVTALDGVLLAAGQTPLLLSGGLDGHVRAWKPGFPPLPNPVDERPSPVSSVALAELSDGLLTSAAWEDGVVRVRRLGDTGAAVELRLGSPVRAVLADGTGRLVLVLPDGVVGVTLR